MGSNPLYLKLRQHTARPPSEIVCINVSDLHLLPTLFDTFENGTVPRTIDIDNPGGIYSGETIHRLIKLLKRDPGVHHRPERLRDTYTLRGLASLLTHATFFQAQTIVPPLQDALNAKISDSTKEHLRHHLKCRTKTPSPKQPPPPPYHLILDTQRINPSSRVTSSGKK